MTTESTEKRNELFQANTDTTPREIPVISFRNRKQELKTLEITALALEIVAKREDCKRHQPELRQLELQRQQLQLYSDAVPVTRASALASTSTPTPDTPSWAWAGVSSIEADNIRIRRLLITSFPKSCTEVDAFRSRDGIDFSHTHQILESRVIIRALNLYPDVKMLHLWEADKTDINICGCASR